MSQCPLTSSAGKFRLLEFVAGRLSAADTIAVSAHVRGCGACARFISGQSAVWDALADWTAAPASSEFNREVYKRIDDAGPESVIDRLMSGFSTWVPRPALTVPVAALLLLGSFYVNRPGVEHPPSAPASVAQAVTAKDAEQVNSALDDLQLLHQLDLVKDEAPDASLSM